VVEFIGSSEIQPIGDQAVRKEFADAESPRKSLTTKEIECLRWCKEGKTNWEIGEILTISEKTVEFHLSNALKKLDATNRLTAVIRGIQRGIIPLWPDS
jgi:DNA-binding CsgD family transcriptional regulator